MDLDYLAPVEITSEVEDYQVDCSNVTVFELTIILDIIGGPAHASLARLRLAESPSFADNPKNIFSETLRSLKVVKVAQRL